LSGGLLGSKAIADRRTIKRGLEYGETQDDRSYNWIRRGNTADERLRRGSYYNEKTMHGATYNPVISLQTILNPEFNCKI